MFTKLELECLPLHCFLAVLEKWLIIIGRHRGVTLPWSPKIFPPLSKFWDPLLPKISAEGGKKQDFWPFFANFSIFSKNFLEKKSFFEKIFSQIIFFSEIARKSLKKCNKKVIFCLKKYPPLKPKNLKIPPLEPKILHPPQSNFWVPPPLTLQTVPTYADNWSKLCDLMIDGHEDFQ